MSAIFFQLNLLLSCLVWQSYKNYKTYLLTLKRALNIPFGTNISHMLLLLPSKDNLFNFNNAANFYSYVAGAQATKGDYYKSSHNNRTI